MARPRDEQKIESIFEATLRLVMKDGLSGLRMQDVAKSAGVATGTLYIYFKDKHELINALYLHLKKKTTSRYVRETDPGMPFKSRFELIYRNYFNSVLQSPEETAFVEQYYRSPFLEQTVRSAGRELLGPIYRLLEYGKQELLIKNADTELLLAQIAAPIAEIVKLHYIGVLKIDTAAVEQAMQMAWDSVRL